MPICFGFNVVLVAFCIDCCFGFYQPGVPARLVGPVVTLRFSCLSVCLSICHSLGRPGNELIAAAVTYGCFELAGLFTSLLQKEAKRCQYYRQ